MGNFISYKDAPVFANFENENRSVGTSSSASLLAASQVSVNLTPNLSANRYLGKVQTKNDFSVSGPLEAKISITFFPMIETWGQSDLNISRANQLAFFNLTGNFQAGHAIQIGNYFFYNSYLQNYSMKINPFQPVVITANFIAYDLDSVSNTEFVGFSQYLPIQKDITKPVYKALHGLTTNMLDPGNFLPTTKTNIDINVDVGRTPVYALGSKKPSTVILNTVERTTTIDGEGINKAVTLSGQNAGSTNIYFQPLDNPQPPSQNAYMLAFDINGRIISQDLSISQGNMSNGKVVIKEIFL